MTTPEIELNPCPFCGVRLEDNRNWQTKLVKFYTHPILEDAPRCPASDVIVPSNEAEAITAWNTRAALPHLPSDGKWEDISIASRLKTTAPMRERLRELSDVDGRDDYDRVVLMLLDDFATLVAHIAPLEDHLSRNLPAPPGSEVPASTGQGVTVKALIRDLRHAASGRAGRLQQTQAMDSAVSFLSALTTKTPDEIAEEDRAHTETIKERDAYHEWADRLARAIGGEEIGEHSNLNNPWQNALEIAEARREEIRREAFEEVAQWHEITGRQCQEIADDNWLSVHDRHNAAVAAKHHNASAAALRLKVINERRSARSPSHDHA